jgi:pimeloyl-ACP methyl ester carboxylesterase
VISFEELRERATMIETGDLDVAGYDFGRPGDPCVTYLHGFPSCSLDMMPVVDRLGDDVRPLAVDFPGFGASDKPSGHPYSIAAAADAVEAMWEEFHVTGTTVLWAHDYGASVCQELIARHLENSLVVGITAVVWHNGGIYPDLHRPTAGQTLLLDPEHGADFAATIDEEAFASAIRQTWGTRRPMGDDELHQMWCSMVQDGGTRIANQLLHYIEDRRRHEARWRTALEDSGLPMWFVWGDLDPVSGAHMIERVEERRWVDTEILRLADVGHWPTLEAPDEVAGAVIAALEA